MLIWGGLMVLGLISVYLWYQLSTLKRFSHVQSEQVSQYMDVLSALSSASHGFGERLIETEGTLRKLIAQRSGAQHSLGSPQTVFSQAKKLLALGASLEEVEKSCGLTKTEAKLIAMTVSNFSDVKLDE